MQLEEFEYFLSTATGRNPQLVMVSIKLHSQFRP